MRLQEYQELSARTMPEGNEELLTNWAFGLMGESGEFVDHLKKYLFHGHDLDLEYASKELGDILWYISAFCTTLGLNLDEVATQNIKKLKRRYPEGFSERLSRERIDGRSGDLMEKYAVPQHLVKELIRLGLCQSEEDALEKVASGEASEMIKEATSKRPEKEEDYG